MTIKCKWGSNNRFVVNPDGQVLPCCYFANVSYSSTNLNGVIKLYNEQKHELNAFTRPIEDILTSDWFTKSLPDSWKDSATTHSICKRWCDNATNKESGD